MDMMDMTDTLDMIDIGSFGLDTGLQIALTIMGVLIGIVAFVSTIVSVWLMIQYSQFNHKENSAGMTGEEVARKVLDDHDLQHILTSFAPREVAVWVLRLLCS